MDEVGWEMEREDGWEMERGGEGGGRNAVGVRVAASREAGRVIVTIDVEMMTRKGKWEKMKIVKGGWMRWGSVGQWCNIGVVARYV